VRELYPICRSITGHGVRQTLRVLQRIAPLQIVEVPSGTPAFDWTVPREWNIRDAYIKNARGERLVDFRRHNLHVVGYSTPIHARMTLSELRPHLHSLPGQPDLIPYRTSYYKEEWGFCLPHRQLESLTAEEEYEVCVDTTLADGWLTYGECEVIGATPDEVLVSVHVCHPSLCNDNLSSLAVATFLARALAGRSLRYTYRFLFVPGTIGAITWLARNEARIDRIRRGLVLACLGDPGPFTYKRSRSGRSATDRTVEHVLAHAGHRWQVREFSPYGYDERQYCSPGFDLPVGRLSRSPHNEFPEYHTSADNLDFVRPESLAESFAVLGRIVDAFEHDRRYVNLNPKCEPQLGRRGLYAAVGGSDRSRREMAILWVLNQADGRRSLLDIAECAQQPFEIINDAAVLLEQHGLLAPCDER
jgi:aminopeptidase-like protein